MNNNTSIIACAAAAAVAVLSAASTFLSRTSESVPATPDPRLVAVEQGLAAQTRELEGIRTSLRQLADQWTGVAELRRAPVPDVVEPKPPAPEVVKSKERQERGESAERKSFRSALAHMFRNGNADAMLGEAEQAEFWKLARTTGLVDEVMAELEEAIVHLTAAKQQLAEAGGNLRGAGAHVHAAAGRASRRGPCWPRDWSASPATSACCARASWRAAARSADVAVRWWLLPERGADSWFSSRSSSWQLFQRG